MLNTTSDPSNSIFAARTVGLLQWPYSCHIGAAAVGGTVASPRKAPHRLPTGCSVGLCIDSCN